MPTRVARRSLANSQQKDLSMLKLRSLAIAFVALAAIAVTVPSETQANEQAPFAKYLNKGWKPIDVWWTKDDEVGMLMEKNGKYKACNYLHHKKPEKRKDPMCLDLN